MAQHVLEVKPVHLAGRSEKLPEVLSNEFAPRFEDKLKALDGGVPVNLIFHTARLRPLQEGKRGIQRLDAPVEMFRLQHA